VFFTTNDKAGREFICGHPLGKLLGLVRGSERKSI
jgi:hypothetical protein